MRALVGIIVSAIVTGCSHAAISSEGYSDPSDANDRNYTSSAESGAPPEMNALSFLVGEWETRATFIDLQDFDADWSATPPQRASCAPMLGGAFIQCKMNTLFPQGFVWNTEAVYSYDRYQKMYRVGYFDDQWALFDVYEGVFEESALKAYNETTGTFGPGGLKGEFIPAGFELIPGASPDEFTFVWMTDFGGVTNWRPAIKIEYSRIRDASQ